MWIFYKRLVTKIGFIIYTRNIIVPSRSSLPKYEEIYAKQILEKKIRIDNIKTV
jgi:hypothetical protein